MIRLRESTSSAGSATVGGQPTMLADLEARLEQLLDMWRRYLRITSPRQKSTRRRSGGSAIESRPRRSPTRNGKRRIGSPRGEEHAAPRKEDGPHGRRRNRPPRKKVGGGEVDGRRRGRLRGQRRPRYQWSRAPPRSICASAPLAATGVTLRLGSAVAKRGKILITRVSLSS